MPHVAWENKLMESIGKNVTVTVHERRRMDISPGHTHNPPSTDVPSFISNRRLKATERNETRAAHRSVSRRLFYRAPDTAENTQEYTDSVSQ